MSKNHKRRGYPGRELKKTKYHTFDTYEEGRAFFTKHLDSRYELTKKHELDCEISSLKGKIEKLRTLLIFAECDLKSGKKTWRKERKERATLEKKITSLKRHIRDITPKRQPLIQSTALARAIKNI